MAFTIASGYPDNYDSALYHIQSIKWIEEYSTVPGLANLHSRFGFNPNIFTFFALTSLVDLFHQEIFSVNFSVLSILIFYFMNKMHHLLKQREVSTLFAFYFILLLIILSLPNLSSPSPDFLATALPPIYFCQNG